MDIVLAPRAEIARHLALLPGSFNPPTKAHVALARAATRKADAVLFVLPRAFPHKEYTGASLADRLAMLSRVAEGEPRFGVAVSDGGLVVEMAREARALYAAPAVSVLCGRDAAERYVEWDYGEPGAIERLLTEFRLLVAPRNGAYVPPERLRFAIDTLDAEPGDDCSSTAVRDAPHAWPELVPAEIADLVERIYGRADTR